jgi:hypothetical protein
VALAIGFARHVRNGQGCAARPLRTTGDGSARERSEPPTDGRLVGAGAERVASEDGRQAAKLRLPQMTLPLELPEVDRILANHRLMHAAEGDLYRVTLADACAGRGWPVTNALAKDLAAEIDGWKGAAPSPWTKDHRLAAAVALRSVGS